MSDPALRATGVDLVKYLRRHDLALVCPKCGEDCGRRGITSLAYTFERCDCGNPHYTHLVEQLWHVDCLITGGTPDEQALHDALVEIKTVRTGKAAREIAYDALTARAEIVHGEKA
jgi:hypothetical protein